jgi:DNA polymerase III gamma/tau subunit
LLRRGEISISQLTNSVTEGGLKHAYIAGLIGIGRTTVPKVIASVLNEPEFTDSPQSDKSRQKATNDK